VSDAKLTDAIALLASYDAPPIRMSCPHSGSPLVSIILDVRNEGQRHQRMPPAPPERRITEYGDDGEEFVVELTEEQYASECVAYERDAAEWRRTGGVFYERGPTYVNATFKFENGGYQRAVTQPGRDRWVVIEEVWKSDGTRVPSE